MKWNEAVQEKPKVCGVKLTNEPPAACPGLAVFVGISSCALCFCQGFLSRYTFHSLRYQIQLLDSVCCLDELACRAAEMTSGDALNGRSGISVRWEPSSGRTATEFDVSRSLISHSDEPEPLVINKKTIASCYKWLDRVVHLCQQPRLNLKVSPPYLLDTIPDLYEKLQSIVNHYQNDYESLSRLEYFRVFVSSVVDRSKRAVQLFDEAKDSIFNPHSHARHCLVKTALIFSHLYHELRALFPDHKFAVNQFRITKPDAAKWWSTNFGQCAVISWAVFQDALCETFTLDSDTSQLHALRTTIDLTCNHHVSIFEFDVFTRLFQPWSNVLETWKALAILHPGYMAFMTYDEVKAVLKQYRIHPGPGSYVFRLSCTKLGQWAIGYVTEDLKILQTIIQNKSLAQALLDGEREGFYRYPNGQHYSSSALHQLVHISPQTCLRVTEEQYQVYCEMGSTFELCKICDENNKNIQLEPCGHLICKDCLLSCQSSGNIRTCPFCRLEVKGIEEVVIKPYKPATDSTNVLRADTSGEMASGYSRPLSVTSLVNSLSHCCPPPVPPRNQMTTSLNANLNGNQKPFLNLHKNSFCHSWMMCANSCCLQPECFVTGSVADRRCSSLVTSTVNSCPFSSYPITTPDSFDRLHDSVCPEPLTSTKRAELKYAQLDLVHTDSDHDQQIDCDIVIQTSSTIQVPLACSVTSQSSLSLISSCVHTGQMPNLVTSDLCVENQNVCNCTVDERCPFIGEPTSSTMSDNTLGPLARYLLSLHPDMDESNAKLLLCITQNQVCVADQIWRHFMPRPKQRYA
ncbi:hypothetical protein PHET_09116 [Paragonimus heterotremus]|uniref:E3 ubiquitin-protein ligase CBL n=1 Tax=Paragonimus heterotremus TaxID=100268 RepID=A0A8J4T364_9TREM|nr:hypothetical protein PHET_09116 [Paragonimus heterotremus]